MSNQIIASELFVALSDEQQQLLAGGATPMGSGAVGATPANVAVAPGVIAAAPSAIAAVPSTPSI